MDAHVTIGALHRHAIKGMNFLDTNIFEYKSHIIWFCFCFFTVTIQLEPVVFGVIGGSIAFMFSKYLDSKGVFIDKQKQRLIEEEKKLEMQILEFERLKAEIDVKQKLVDLKLSNVKADKEIDDINNSHNWG